MTGAQSVIVYVVAWWMTIFMVAPIGAMKVTDATRKKTWLIKILATTVLAGFVTWGIYGVIHSGIISVK